MSKGKKTFNAAFLNYPQIISVKFIVFYWMQAIFISHTTMK